MITLNEKIQNDLSSSVNNFELIFSIASGGSNYYLSTKSQTLDGIYYDDLIMKVGGLKESIDLRTKKIKLTGTTITINNAKINGVRFSDTIQGEMTGGTVDVALKTPSCSSITDCITIALLRISGVTHDNSQISLKCEDRYIDEVHKELPLSEHTLYEGVQTFVGDNEKRIPVLYGHLKQAPAVVYIDNHETESPFSDNNIFIVPDRAFKDNSYNILGIKDDGLDSQYTKPERPNQLIKQDVLSVKLGDHAATVYCEPPDRLNLKMVHGDANNDYEFDSGWVAQFSVSEDKDYINLFTESHDSASKHISSGHLLCGEVSSLLSINSYKPKYYRYDEYVHDEGGVSGDMTYWKHFTSSDVDSNFSSPSVGENFDMLSLTVNRLDDITEDAQDGYIDLEYNTETYNFLDSTIYDLEFEEFERPFHYNYNALVFEIEFEQLKSSISRSKGRRSETYVDANIVGAFNFKNLPTTIDDQLVLPDPIFYFEFCVFPQQPSYVTYNTEVVRDYMTFEDHEITLDPLGVVKDIYSSKSSSIEPISGNPYTVYYDWNEQLSAQHYDDDEDANDQPDSYYINHNWQLFSEFFHRTAPFRLYMNASRNQGTEIEDYRHTFHTERQSTMGNNVNTWRMYYRWIDGVDWTSQNIFTGYITPHVDSYNYDPEQNKFVHGVKADLGGMFLKRTWYQEKVFDESFFVNAKGKYTQMQSQNDENGNPLLVSLDYAGVAFVSTSLDYDSDATARNQDLALLQLIDYLTNDRFKEYYANGYKYELVISCIVSTAFSDEFEELTIFDFDVSSLTVNHSFDDFIAYRLGFNSKALRGEFDSQGLHGDWLEDNIWGSLGESVKLRYARRNVTSSGVLDSWTFLEDEDNENFPFTISTNYNYDTDESTTETAQLIEFDDNDDANRLVQIYIGTYEDEVGNQVEYGANQLIRRASSVVGDILEKEIGLPASSVNRKNVEDSRYLLDFSLYQAEEGIDVMQKISQCSPFFYRTRLSDSTPSVVGIKHSYSDSDIDKSINENQILKYKFTKSKIEDISIKCRVKYGFDYVKEEYTEVTPDIEHPDGTKQNYINMYNIQDEETYTLEYEAPYIQEKISAEVLSKHLFELNKNQHLLLSFSIPLGDGIELEVGDILDFVNNSGNRVNIGDTKPYGLDMTTSNVFIDQLVFPYFMITSIKKDLSKVDIECVQLHNLEYSEYDDLYFGLAGEDDSGDDSGEDDNGEDEPIYSEIPIAVITGETEFGNSESVTLDGSSSYDPDGTIVEYYWVVPGVGSFTTDSIAFDTPSDGSGYEDITLTVTDNDGNVSETVTHTIVFNWFFQEMFSPTADAGDNQEVVYGETVTLDASGSSDYDNGIIGYTWSQTGGVTVDVDNYEQAIITFTAPDELTTLTFRLVVFDEDFLFSEPDYVDIVVAPAVLGDLNQDVNIDILDVVIMVNLCLNGQHDPNADMNDDGVTDVMDVVILLNQILN